MVSNLYQEYIYVIGKLKDVYKLDVDVDHRNIHTFYMNKRPVFKLLYGEFQKETSPSVVVSFHLDLHHAEAIQWFINIYSIHPLIKIHDSYIEDSNGEFYLGEEALSIREIYQTQEILENWLSTSDRSEIEEYVKSKVTGRYRAPNPTFDSQKQRSEAIIDFEKLKKPADDEGVH